MARYNLRMESDRQLNLPLDEERLKCLSSGVRIQLFAVFKLRGPSSISEVAPLLSRPADALYHHIRKLLSAGLLRQTGSRKAGKRDEAIYDVTAEWVRSEPPPWKPGYAAAYSAFRTSLYEASRRFSERSLQGEVDASLNQVHHLALWLSDENAREFVRRLNELEIWAMENQSPQNGASFAFLSSFLPTSVEKQEL